MSPLIGWDELLPSDASTVRAEEIRDLWASLSAGLNESLEWDGVVAGQLRAGATPSFITTEANIASLFESNASSTGKLAFASDTSRLFTLGLATTAGRAGYAGGPQLIEHADQATRGFAWHIQSGASLLVAPDDDTISIFYSDDGLTPADVIYATDPQVLVTSDNTNYMPVINSIGAASFSIGMRPIQGSAANTTITWASSGTSTI